MVIEVSLYGETDRSGILGVASTTGGDASRRLADFLD
jgi:hypothetical protein